MTEAQVVAEFKFRNDGKRSVKLLSLKSSCACTTANLGKKEYASGESGKVRATFVFGDRVGRQEKTVLVQTDDPAEPVTILKLTTFIPQVLEVTPTFAYWGPAEKLDSKRLKINVLNGAPVKDLEVVSSNPKVDSQIERVAEEKNMRWW